MERNIVREPTLAEEIKELNVPVEVKERLLHKLATRYVTYEQYKEVVSERNAIDEQWREVKRELSFTKTLLEYYKKQQCSMVETILGLAKAIENMEVKDE